MPKKHRHLHYQKMTFPLNDPKTLTLSQSLDLDQVGPSHRSFINFNAEFSKLCQPSRFYFLLFFAVCCSRFFFFFKKCGDFEYPCKFKKRFVLEECSSLLFAIKYFLCVNCCDDEISGWRVHRPSLQMRKKGSFSCFIFTLDQTKIKKKLSSTNCNFKTNKYNLLNTRETENIDYMCWYVSAFFSSSSVIVSKTRPQRI